MILHCWEALALDSDSEVEVGSTFFGTVLLYMNVATSTKTVPKRKFLKKNKKKSKHSFWYAHLSSIRVIESLDLFVQKPGLVSDHIIIIILTRKDWSHWGRKRRWLRIGLWRVKWQSLSGCCPHTSWQQPLWYHPLPVKSKSDQYYSIF